MSSTSMQATGACTNRGMAYVKRGELANNRRLYLGNAGVSLGLTPMNALHY